MRQFAYLKKFSQKMHYYFYVSKSLSVSVLINLIEGFIFKIIDFKQ